MVDGAEEVADISLEDELVALDEPDPQPLQGVGGRPLRAEPEAAGQEVGLEQGLEDDLGRLLAHPVFHSGNAQGPLRPVGLGYLHPPHRRGAIPTCTEAALQLIQHALDAISLHRGQGHTIDPGRATIGSDSFPRLPQDVAPVDAVIQGVEPPTLRLLGRSP